MRYQNDVVSLSNFLAMEITRRISEDRVLLEFDLVELAEKRDTSKGMIKEAFLHLANANIIDLFIIKDSKRKVGVVVKDDPRRNKFLKVNNLK